MIDNPAPSVSGSEPGASAAARGEDEAPQTPQDLRQQSLDQKLEQAHEQWRRHWEERRSHQRYPLGTPYSCNLELDSGHYPPMPVQLQDISLGGACLLISSLVELRQGEMGELHHPSQQGSNGASLHGQRLRICWQEMRDWITAVGVAFEPPLVTLPLEERLLDHLHPQRVVERDQLGRRLFTL